MLLLAAVQLLVKKMQRFSNGGRQIGDSKAKKAMSLADARVAIRELGFHSLSELIDAYKKGEELVSETQSEVSSLRVRLSAKELMLQESSSGSAATPVEESSAYIDRIEPVPGEESQPGAPSKENVDTLEGMLAQERLFNLNKNKKISELCSVNEKLQSDVKKLQSQLESIKKQRELVEDALPDGQDGSRFPRSALSFQAEIQRLKDENEALSMQLDRGAPLVRRIVEATLWWNSKMEAVIATMGICRQGEL